MHIAIIEDDKNISELLGILMRDLNANTVVFENGFKGLDGVMQSNFDCLILDLMLPGMNGIEICKKLRQYKPNLPILMLTSQSEIEDKVLGLEIGADDYLIKPFNNVELVARVKALLRRSNKQLKSDIAEKELLIIGELQLNHSERTLTKNSIEIVLTAKEFDLLYLFMKQPSRAFSRIEILERVWGEQFEGLEHTVNSNINRLRSKIEDDPNHPKYLVTVWGLGYKFNKIIL
jgi:two-component system, OmpR family, alkaline phosphatase synthesis response regulator PhoP